MAKLAPLVGEWKGEGSIQMGREGRSTFVAHEVVTSRLDGRALLIGGAGYERGDDGANGEQVHDALAIVTWDSERGSYRFDATTAQAGRAEATLTIEADGKWIWEFETPRGNVRYTLTIEGDKWQELGEFNPKGTENWMRFLEMKLERLR